MTIFIGLHFILLILKSQNSHLVSPRFRLEVQIEPPNHIFGYG